jgi:hypothetical protein
MIAIRRTYNGNADWVYPFPLSFLQSCHSLGGVKVVLRPAARCMAVGWFSRNRNHENLLAERWNGSTWRIRATPGPSGATKSRFNGVSCASATSCVSVGAVFAPPATCWRNAGTARTGRC